MTVPNGDRELLVEYLPELRYHPLERYRADSAATLTDAYVRGRHSSELRRSWPARLLARSAPTPRVPALSLAFLVPENQPYPEGGDVAQRGDFIAAHAPTLEEDSRRMHEREGMGHVVYCRVAPGEGGRRWLQYWFFFYNNPFGVAGFGPHQGDWEMVQVGLGPDDEPFAATYAQHHGGQRRDWDDVEKADGRRPVVYIAKGSHASFFTAGRQSRRLLPDDHTSDAVAPVPHTPSFLDPQVDRWLEWPGSWGGSQRLLSESPEGPAFQTKWKCPDWFHDHADPSPIEGEASLAEEGAELVPLPTTPALQLAMEEDGLRLRYAFPAETPAGETEPTRLEVAVHGQGGLPRVTTLDVTSLSDEATLPIDGLTGPYTVHVGLYDADGHEQLLLPMAPVASGSGGDGAGLEEAATSLDVRPLPAEPMRPLVRAQPLRVLVQAPPEEKQPLVALQLALDGQHGPAGPWHVAALFGPDPEAPELARWFSLTTRVAAAPALDLPAQTFQAARELMLPAGWTIEADVPSTAVQIDPPDDDDDAAVALGGDPPTGWALEAIRARQAWDLAPRPGGLSRGEGIVIGQPDTGYTRHPQLGQDALDLVRDLDVLTGSDDAHAVLEGFPPLQFPSHGTGTASVAVSREGDQAGERDIVGSAPRARLVPIRAAETVVHVRNAELAVAVAHARAVGCHVITVSMGGIAYPGSLRAIIRRAVADGLIVMAAAGQPLPMVVQPASLPECLAVAGTRPDGKPWRLSARGSEVDWCAPAKSVWVAATTNEPGPDQFHLAPHSGTSFAVALSAGVAALWLAHHGRETIIERFGRERVQAAFRELVRRTVDPPPPGWDTERWGPGIINAERLLSADLDTIDVPEPEPVEPAPRWRWALDRIISLADPDEPSEVEQGVLDLVGGDRDLLDDHADELVFRLAEHEQVRKDVLGARPPGDGAALDADPAAARASLAAVASPALRAALQSAA